MTGESQVEFAFAALVLLFATMFATSYIQIPYETIQSPFVLIFLVIIALVAFPVMPMISFSLFALLAIIVFNRNIQTTLFSRMSASQAPKLVVSEVVNTVPTLAPISDSYSATTVTHPITERPEVLETGNTVYGANSIGKQSIANPSPFSTFQSDHRSFEQFNETDVQNPVLGRIVEGFLPANYGDEQGAPVEGEYPRDQARAKSEPESREYSYRPSADTGSNDFVPIHGPKIDEKL